MMTNIFKKINIVPTACVLAVVGIIFSVVLFVDRSQPRNNFVPLGAPAWTVQYECNDEPDAATPAWTLGGTDEASVSAGILTIATTSTNTNYYYYVWSADNATGWTAEAKAQVITATYGANMDSRLLWCADGTKGELVYIYADRIIAYDNGSLTAHMMDTTDDFHVYRLTVIGTVGKVYVDDVLVLTTTALTYTATDEISFGDYSATDAKNIDIDWDYIYWDENGAFAPSTGTNTQINIGDDWKEITAIKINIGDVWKVVEGLQINIGDAWKEIF